MPKRNRQGEFSDPIFRPKYVAIATAFYVFFFAIGFLKGRQVRSTEEFLIASVGNRVMPLRDHHDPHGPVRFAYSCNGKALAYWDIDKKTIMPASTEVFEAAFEEDATQPSELPVTTAEALAFLGGGTGAWTAKDLIEKATNEEEESLTDQLGKYSLVIAGSVMGLWSGYWYAIHGQACDSPQVLDALRKVKVWEKAAPVVFHKEDHLARVFAAESGFISEEERKSLESQLDQKERAAFQEGVPINSDLFALRFGNDVHTSEFWTFIAMNYPHVDVDQRSDVTYYICQGGGMLFVSAWIFAVWHWYSERRVKLQKPASARRRQRRSKP